MAMPEAFCRGLSSHHPCPEDSALAKAGQILISPGIPLGSEDLRGLRGSRHIKHMERRLLASPPCRVCQGAEMTGADCCMQDFFRPGLAELPCSEVPDLQRPLLEAFSARLENPAPNIDRSLGGFVSPGRRPAAAFHGSAKTSCLTTLPRMPKPKPRAEMRAQRLPKGDRGNAAFAETRNLGHPHPASNTSPVAARSSMPERELSEPLNEAYRHIPDPCPTPAGAVAR